MNISTCLISISFDLHVFHYLNRQICSICVEKKICLHCLQNNIRQLVQHHYTPRTGFFFYIYISTFYNYSLHVPFCLLRISKQIKVKKCQWVHFKVGYFIYNFFSLLKILRILILKPLVVSFCHLTQNKQMNKHFCKRY